MPSKQSYEIEKVRGKEKKTNKTFSLSLCDLNDKITELNELVESLENSNSSLSNQIQVQRQVNDDLKGLLNLLNTGIPMENGVMIGDLNMGNYTLVNIQSIKKRYSLSNDILYTNGCDCTVNATSYAKYAAITINTLSPSPTTIRVQVNIYTATQWHPIYAEIRKNGVTQATFSHDQVSWAMQSKDFIAEQGDEIELYCKKDPGADHGEAKEFAIRGINDLELSEGFEATNS